MKIKRDKENTRRVILDAALKEFSQKGYSCVKLEEIAAKTHVSRGSIYWHFKSKQNLLFEMITDFQLSYKQDIEALPITSMNALEKLKQMGMTFFEKLIKNEYFFRIEKLLIFRLHSQDAGIEVQNFLKKQQKQWLEETAKLIEDGQKEGIIRSDRLPIDLANFIIRAYFGLEYAFLESSRTLSNKELDLQLDLILDAMKPRS